MFVDCNIEYAEDEEDNNPDDLLNRKEFLELFMRIALAKSRFNKTESAKGIPDGLSYLVENVLLPVSDQYSIRDFRLKYCHGERDLCGVLLKNSMGLKRLYSRF
jgi:hypothetical protein